MRTIKKLLRKSNIMPENSLPASNNAFALKIYTQLKNSDENLFISPFSIFTAITMIYAGAKGGTEQEIRDLLSIKIAQRRLPLQIHDLVEKILSIESTEISIANSIWADLGYVLSDSFLYIMDENYNGESYKEDFKNVDEICKKINQWVANNTKNKIKEITNPNTFDPDYKLVLLNAIYFNGIWEHPFDENLTETSPFTLLNGSEIPVEMMHQKKPFSYFDNDLFQLISLNYEGVQRFGMSEHFSMMIFLPKNQQGIDDMEDLIDAESILSYKEKLMEQEVDLFLPKFKLESKYELKKDLRELGMRDSFSEAADFSGVVDTSKSNPPVIGEIIHKAFVNVNEEGTEAAAATMIAALPKGFPIIREIPVFKADHPFMFLIMDSESNTILFLGRVMNPKLNEI